MKIGCKVMLCYFLESQLSKTTSGMYPEHVNPNVRNETTFVMKRSLYCLEYLIVNDDVFITVNAEDGNLQRASRASYDRACTTVLQTLSFTPEKKIDGNLIFLL